MDDIEVRIECVRLADNWSRMSGADGEKIVRRAKILADFVLGVAKPADVLPADVVSGLGEGNTMAGEDILRVVNAARDAGHSTY